MGWVFMIIALVLFFLAGVGSTVVPAATTWGLFALTLGLILDSPFVTRIWVTRPNQ